MSTGAPADYDGTSSGPCLKGLVHILEWHCCSCARVDVLVFSLWCYDIILCDESTPEIISSHVSETRLALRCLDDCRCEQRSIWWRIC
eukprot:SAG31_NODE_3332_length_4395_cov_3.833799_1_plen_88_part_00